MTNNKTIYERFMGKYVRVNVSETSLLGVLKEANFDFIVLNPSLVSYCTDAKVAYGIENVDLVIPADRIYYIGESSKEKLEQIVKDGEIANKVKQREIQDKLEGTKPLNKKNSKE